MRTVKHLILTVIFKAASVLSATYYCENGVLTQTISGKTNGTIRTVESGTSYYDNNLNCGWLIDGGPGTRIQVIITGVDLQLAPVYTSCGTYDHLSIMDGDSSKTEAITSICGERNPYEVISTGQHMYLKFYSNDKNFYQHSGVTVSFKVFNNNECPPDWTSLNTTDQCYRIRQSPSTGKDWYSAYHNCLFSQSNLAVIDQNVVFNSLLAYAQSLSVSAAWVGLTDIEKEGTFKWINKEALASYIRVYGNIDDMDCAVIDFDTQKFEIKRCEKNKYASVCQRNKATDTVIYSIPQEEDEKETEVISLRWKIILGIGGGVIAIVIIFIFYCKFHKGEPTVPSSSNTARLAAYKPEERPTSRRISSDRDERYSNGNERQRSHRSQRTSPPSYSEIPQNNVHSVHINPQINVNVTVNQNNEPRDQPPAYSFYAPTA